MRPDCADSGVGVRGNAYWRLKSCPPKTRAQPAAEPVGVNSLASCFTGQINIDAQDAQDFSGNGWLVFLSIRQPVPGNRPSRLLVQEPLILFILLILCIDVNYEQVDSPACRPSPHFSPGGMIMAQDFFLQRVLATEERSGFYGRGSMCALEEKRPARACPAPSVFTAIPPKDP